MDNPSDVLPTYKNFIGNTFDSEFHRVQSSNTLNHCSKHPVESITKVLSCSLFQDQESNSQSVAVRQAPADVDDVTSRMLT